MGRSVSPAPAWRRGPPTAKHRIPYPTVRNPDPDFGARMRTPARAAALLARLVQAAVHVPSHDAPPAETASVRVAPAGRVDDDAGEWGLFARRVVQAGRFDTLSIQSVWRAWCEAGHDGDGHHQDVAGGINRSEFPRRVREVIPLPVAKQTTVDGRNVRAWYGWTLLDDAPAETSAPDAPVEREVVSRTFQRLGGATDARRCWSPCSSRKTRRLCVTASPSRRPTGLPWW